MKQVTNEDYNINVEQELFDKPILNSSEYLSTLFNSFMNSRTKERASEVGIQIITSGRSVFKNILTKQQNFKLNEIINKIDELSDTPLNRRSKTRIPKKEFILASEGVGIIIELLQIQGLITNEKQIRENTVIGIDGGYEGFAPASKNIVEQSNEVFDKYNENQ